MEQKKIGSFLRELRTEKGLTQEQLAERLNVAGRTVSRWENGNNMPDLSIMVELADFYDVDIRELLNGERKSEGVTDDMKETLEIVADYTDSEKEKILDKVSGLGFCLAFVIICLIVMFVFNIYMKTSWLNDLFVYLMFLGLIFSFRTIIHGLQLKGKMSKERLKRMAMIILPICIMGMLVLTSVIFIPIIIDIFT